MVLEVQWMNLEVGSVKQFWSLVQRLILEVGLVDDSGGWFSG